MLSSTTLSIFCQYIDYPHCVNISIINIVSIYGLSILCQYIKLILGQYINYRYCVNILIMHIWYTSISKGSSQSELTLLSFCPHSFPTPSCPDHQLYHDHLNQYDHYHHMTNFWSHLVDMIVDCVRRDNKVFFIKNWQWITKKNLQQKQQGW